MIIGVPKEAFPGEARVAWVPSVLPPMTKVGFEFVLETGAGVAAGYPDEAYAARGVRIAASRAEVFQQAEIITQVLCPGANDRTGLQDLPLVRRGQFWAGFFRPLGELSTVQAIAATGVNALALELMPRITRAQSMDVLSSMATVSGYKAVLLAANHLPRLLPMLTTAAGTVTPARALIIGAGVAGLQAIATARRLGAVVSAYDLRPAVKEQVQSLGARFVELPLETQNSEDARGYARQQDEAFYQKQRELLHKAVADSDIVITTAVVPGQKAPLLVTRAMVETMAPGSVIVDLAAERGGNCELTRAGEVSTAHGVTLIGLINLAGTVPFHASQLYARNLANYLGLLFKDGRTEPDWSDPIAAETLLTRGGEIVQPRVREYYKLPAAAAAQ